METYAFRDLAQFAGRLANAFNGLGITRGDIIAVQLSQTPETLLTHLAAHAVGAITLPISVLFGPDALAHRLQDSGAKLLVTRSALAERAGTTLNASETLTGVITTDGPAPPPPGSTIAGHYFWQLIEVSSPSFRPIITHRDDPAMLMYTSGTTGDPKGVLHAHRVLLGHLPGVMLPHELAPKPGDRFWTPADWAWARRTAQHSFPRPLLGLAGLCRARGKI